MITEPMMNLLRAAAGMKPHERIKLGQDSQILSQGRWRRTASRAVRDPTAAKIKPPPSRAPPAASPQRHDLQLHSVAAFPPTPVSFGFNQVS